MKTSGEKHHNSWTRRCQVFRSSNSWTRRFQVFRSSCKFTGTFSAPYIYRRIIKNEVKTSQTSAGKHQNNENNHFNGDMDFFHEIPVDLQFSDGFGNNETDPPGQLINRTIQPDLDTNGRIASLLDDFLSNLLSRSNPAMKTLVIQNSFFRENKKLRFFFGKKSIFRGLTVFKGTREFTALG